MISYAIGCIRYFIEVKDVIPDSRPDGYVDDYFALRYTLERIMKEDTSLHLNWSIDSFYSTVSQEKLGFAKKLFDLLN